MRAFFNKIKALFRTMFSVDFLLKILLIVLIIAVIDFTFGGSAFVRVYHSGKLELTSGYSDLLKIRVVE